MLGAGTAAGIIKRNNMIEAQRFMEIAQLLSSSTKGKLTHGDLGRVAEMFKCSVKHISRVSKRYQQQKTDSMVMITVANKLKVNPGQHGLDIESVRQTLKSIPMKSRTTLQGLAYELQIPRSTLHHNLKTLGLSATSRFLRPLLTDTNEERGSTWALRWLKEA